MTSPEVKTMQSAITQRLSRMRGRLRSQLVVEGVARWLLTAVAIAALTFVADWKFELGRPVRIGMIALSAAALAFIAVRYIVLPLMAQWSIFDVAGAIDVRGMDTVEDAISPKVATLFERFGKDDEGKASTQLTSEAARRSYAALEQIRFEDRLNRKHRNRSLLGVVAGADAHSGYQPKRPSILT